MSSRWTSLRAWLLMVPLLAVMIAVIGWPLADTIHLSFTNARLIGTEGDFVGLANFQKALTGAPFRHALSTTATFALISVGLEMVLGVLAALLLDQEFRGRTALRAMMILPWALPTIVNATLWRLIYNPEYGALNSLLTQLGIIGELSLMAGRAVVRDGLADRRRRLEELSARRTHRACRPAGRAQGHQGRRRGRRRRRLVTLQASCCGPISPAR